MYHDFCIFLSINYIYVLFFSCYNVPAFTSSILHSSGFLSWSQYCTRVVLIEMCGLNDLFDLHINMSILNLFLVSFASI